MLGDFILRGLMMILGYAYPAFECFKTVERNKVDINDLRFWCQYWMIIAAIAVFERFAEFFISWLPFYGEMKVVFIVYLWSPKFKGTTYVYEGLFRPLVAKHETDIDQTIQELKLRAWDLSLHYWQHFAQIGQAAFMNMMQVMLTQSYMMKQNEGSHGTSPPGDILRPSAESRKTTTKSTWPPADQSKKGNEMPNSPGSSPKRENNRPKLRKVNK